MSSACEPVRERLAAGPKRGLGCANQVAHEATVSGALLEEVVAALDDPRPAVVSRAASALKKVQKEQPRALDRFARKVLGTAASCEVLEGRWNLTIIAGRLRLRGNDRALAIDLLFEALGSASAFLRVFALQSLVDLSGEDPALRLRLRPVLQDFLANGTAAMKARARKLQPLLEHTQR